MVTAWSALRMRNVQISFSISDTFTIAAALLFGPSAGTVIATLEALVGSLRIIHANKSATWVWAVFDVTAGPLAMWVSAHVFFAIAQTGPLASQPGRVRDVIGPLAAFAAVYFALNSSFTAIAVANERKAHIAGVWWEHFSSLWLTQFAGASIAGVLILMNAARVIDVTTITLVLPLVLIVHMAYKAALDRIQEQVEHYAKVASYEAALRSTADAVLVTNRDGLVTLINPAAERITGWAERDAFGRPVTEVFCAVDPTTNARDDRQPGGDATTAREYLLTRRDGVEHQ